MSAVLEFDILAVRVLYRTGFVVGKCGCDSAISAAHIFSLIYAI